MGNNEETTTTEKTAIKASPQTTAEFAAKASSLVGEPQKQPVDHPEYVNRQFWAQHGY